MAIKRFKIIYQMIVFCIFSAITVQAEAAAGLDVKAEFEQALEYVVGEVTRKETFPLARHRGVRWGTRDG